jgi:hypothetical protein
MRQAFGRTRGGPPAADAKLKAIRHAVKYEFPTADIDQMLSEIERGREA